MHFVIKLFWGYVICFQAIFPVLLFCFTSLCCCLTEKILKKAIFKYEHKKETITLAQLVSSIAP